MVSKVPRLILHFPNHGCVCFTCLLIYLFAIGNVQNHNIQHTTTQNRRKIDRETQINTLLIFYIFFIFLFFFYFLFFYFFIFDSEPIPRKCGYYKKIPNYNNTTFSPYIFFFFLNLCVIVPSLSLFLPAVVSLFSEMVMIPFYCT